MGQKCTTNSTSLSLNSAIISAIGGSLSIFLGFSCWGCSKPVVSCMKRLLTHQASPSISPGPFKGLSSLEKRRRFSRKGLFTFLVGDRGKRKGKKKATNLVTTVRTKNPGEERSGDAEGLGENPRCNTMIV